jgi:4-hydroxy-2-oxoheptanedioate aldolase
MVKNAVLEKINRGDHVIGTFFHSGSALVMDAIGLSGMDYVIIDKEHSPIAVETAADMIRAAEAKDLTPFVRIKEISRSSVLKLLDLGAKGLIVPAVNGVEDVKKLVEYSKYPPVGNRGMAMGRGSDFGLGALPLPEHWAQHNRETLMIPMCETVGFLEHVEEIAAMDGVDGIFIGPCDLSIALGKPGEFDDPSVNAAFQRVVDACKAEGKFCLIYAPNTSLAERFIKMGFSGCASAIDINLLLSAYLQLSKELKAVL